MVRGALVAAVFAVACGNHVESGGVGGSASERPDAGSGTQGDGPDGGGGAMDGGTSQGEEPDGGGGATSDGGVDGDGGIGDDGGVDDDGGIGNDGGPIDGGPLSVLDGGPCISGASGATAYRVRWADGGGTAYPVYEVNGLPDKSRDHTGAYGYQIGFSASFVDPYLGEGGVLLNSSDFIDIELSTLGLASISSATLSIYGRSYNTTASGSFDWQTFEGIGAAPTNLVSNVAPYQWYSADMTPEISAGDNGVLVRIKAGPSSSSLVVHRIEICMDAD